MAGEDPDGLFDPEEFYADIRAAMLMGTPNAVEERVTFHFQDVIDHNAPVDDTNNPYDWEDPDPPAEGTEDSTPPGLQVTCIVDWEQTTAEEETRIGDFKRERGVIVILGPEWDQVQDFTHVVIDGDRYNRGTKVTHGLYGADVHLVNIEAVGAR